MFIVRSAKGVSEWPFPSSYLLQRRTAAVEVVCRKDQSLAVGKCVHLDAGTTVHIAGNGISGQTVRVESENRQFIILRRSLQEEAVKSLPA